MAARRYRDDDSNPDVQSLLNSFFRLDPRAQVLVVVLLAAAGLVFYVAYLQHSRSRIGPSPVGSVQMLLGNPSNALPDTGSHDNYLMDKSLYALSYNDAKGEPNWVSWRVTAADLGNAPRKQGFDADVTLPMGFYRVTERDYNGSGFDRGHMCPHSDRAASIETSYATFVMSNIIPQAPNVNRKAWEQLESYGRELVSREHDRLYITAGPVGQGGVGSKGERVSLANGRVVVPAACWKVIVVVPEDGSEDDLAKINPRTRVIAVLMPNDNRVVDDNWAKFRVRAADVESKTGYHFFGNIRPDLAETLREKIDVEPIAAPREHSYRHEA